MYIYPGTYDALTVSGGFGEGHIPCTALHEMIRVVKQGNLDLSNNLLCDIWGNLLKTFSICLYILTVFLNIV